MFFMFFFWTHPSFFLKFFFSYSHGKPSVFRFTKSCHGLDNCHPSSRIRGPERFRAISLRFGLRAPSTKRCKIFRKRYSAGKFVWNIFISLSTVGFPKTIHRSSRVGLSCLESLLNTGIKGSRKNLTGTRRVKWSQRDDSLRNGNFGQFSR